MTPIVPEQRSGASLCNPDAGSEAIHSSRGKD